MDGDGTSAAPPLAEKCSRNDWRDASSTMLAAAALQNDRQSVAVSSAFLTTTLAIGPRWRASSFLASASSAGSGSNRCPPAPGIGGDAMAVDDGATLDPALIVGDGTTVDDA